MKKSVNIVWIHSHFNYWMGGTKYIYEVISRLKNSFNVSVFIEDYSEFSENQYSNTNIQLNKINYLSSNKILYWLIFPLMILIDYWKLKSFFKQKQFTKQNTLIISSMFPANYLTFLLGYKHIQLCFEPFAFFYDNKFIEAYNPVKKLLIKILSYLYSPLDKIATKSANQVLTLNSITQKNILRVFGVNSIKTQAGVNSELFKPYVSNEVKKKYTFPFVIHSTDYSPVKGTDRVIKAFSIASKKVPKAKLLITSTITNDEARNDLESLAKDLGIINKVKFLGFVPIITLPQLYTKASVLVQGSNSLDSGTTSMALPVKEAMCCGTPAIRPDAGGEDVINGKSGYLVDPENITKMADKMILLLKNEKLSKKMGKMAREDISKKYTWDNTTNVFINAIMEIAK